MIKQHGSQTRVHQQHFVACARVWVKKIFWILWFSDEFCILTNKQICARALPKTLNLPKTKSNHKLLRSSEVHHLLQILNKNHYEELFASFNSMCEWLGFSTHLLILRGSSWPAVSLIRFWSTNRSLLSDWFILHVSNLLEIAFVCQHMDFHLSHPSLHCFLIFLMRFLNIPLLISECHLSSRFLFGIVLHGEQFRVKSFWNVRAHAGMLLVAHLSCESISEGFIWITQNHQLLQIWSCVNIHSAPCTSSQIFAILSGAFFLVRIIDNALVSGELCCCLPPAPRVKKMNSTTSSHNARPCAH